MLSIQVQYCGRVHKENPLVKYLWVKHPTRFDQSAEHIEPPVFGQQSCQRGPRSQRSHLVNAAIWSTQLSRQRSQRNPAIQWHGHKGQVVRNS